MENNETQKNNLKDKVLQKIQLGKVSMRPKLFFTLNLSLIGFVAASAVLVSIFLFNFIFFSLRMGSHAMLLGFGWRGLGSFIAFFPWGLLLLDLLLLIVLESLLRKFRFGYKTPVLYLVLGTLALSFSLGFFLDFSTTINDRMFVRARHLPPPIGGMYEGAMPPPGNGICRRCVITYMSGNELWVTDFRNGSTTIKVILPFDDSRATTSGLELGDRVFIAGDEEDGVVRAFGVRKMMREGSDRPMFWVWFKRP